MFLSQLRIENFRAFGEGKDALTIRFNPGLTAIVGENDTGKTAVIDALRLALGTRDQEYFRVDENDFHQPSDGSARAKETGPLRAASRPIRRTNTLSFSSTMRQ
jgi:putative ATP-dependent endonuclease of OLD family